ncbi:unnamed protein product [Spirodela intermedia]|uniref:Uncharacterized protein n=2 Tax=Spirodela intermedia TaxID=51605 RepID=A0A7I8IGF2_SPIIN|nr:unnamed protein product [Spirodela intermedia]CAA6656374.1 unnamed protein product [Spirodela intermedia]CAA7391944.1 unnamed protein product [Spirodela intermedia]
MSLNGRGQGVDLGTSSLSLILSIFFFILGRALPNEPLKRFPLFVFLSPRPHVSGEATHSEEDDEAAGAALAGSAAHAREGVREPE